MRNRIKKVDIVSAFCAVAAFAAVLTGCEPETKGKLLVAEVDLTPSNTMQAVVACTESGSLFPVDSATVTVNGEDVPPSFLGNISFTLTPVAPAADVTMHFSFEDVDILKTLVMPTKPPAVTNNRQTLVTSPITISWGTITPTPDNVEVSVSFNTQSGDPFSAVLPGDTTTYDIPANTLIASSSITVMVAALNSTTNLGSSVMAGSIYQVGNQGVVSFPSTP